MGRAGRRRAVLSYYCAPPSLKRDSPFSRRRILSSFVGVYASSASRMFPLAFEVDGID